MHWLGKIWGWIKGHWQWILFPVGLVLFVLSVLSGSRAVTLAGLNLKKLDESERKEDMEIAKADAVRDAKLKELADAHQERLASLSREQERELEDLTEKPVEEVVKWFDRL